MVESHSLDEGRREDNRLFGDLLWRLLTAKAWTGTKLAEELHVDASTVSKWRRGHRPHPDLATRIETLLGCEPGTLRRPLEQEIREFDRRTATGRLKRGSETTSPYRGLFAFREEDAPFFHGRESLTDALEKAVRDQPFVGVVGPSGSGKSSLVFAGLLPRLREEGGWRIVSFRPRSRPFRSLAASLVSLKEPATSEAEALVETENLGKALYRTGLRLEQTLRQGERLLIVADQFEELFTLGATPEIWRRFVDVLLEGARKNASQLRLVITLRADFLGRALSYRPLADALQQADLKVAPMNRQELRDAIEKPAHRLRVQTEEGLVARILDALSDEPGQLPLLEFALTRLWEERRAGLITHEAYDRMGGVELALSGFAEEIYGGMCTKHRKDASRVFLQLVRPGEGTHDTGRVTTRTEIGEQDWLLVRCLASRRLVVTGRDDTTGDETVEIVHEALITNWKRLREWMEADGGFRLWQERLRAALRQWQMSDHDEGALLRGVLLAEATAWKTTRGEDLSPAEARFIEASVSTMEAARQHELAQAQALAEQQAKYAKLRGRQAIALGVAFLVAVAFAGFTWIQRTRSEKQRLAESVPTIPLAADCGIEPTAPAGARSQGPLTGQRLVVAGVWKNGTTEAGNFVKVLQAFRQTTGASVMYAYDPRPRDMASDLTKRIDGGCPPDVVLVPNPGLLRDLARRKQLRPIGGVAGDLMAKNYSTAAASMGTVDGVLYGVWFKAANKSMIWYRPDIFQRAAVRTPKSWDDLKGVAGEIYGQGLAPFAVAGADGWTLTDWFENTYLATAGGEMYDKLANHTVPWNDPSVKRALNTLAEIFGKQEWLEGGTKGALEMDYQRSVESVFSASPTAAMVYEGDFVAEAGRDVRKRAEGPATPQFFGFPEIDGSKPLVVGGDLAALITDNEAGRQLIRFLATPEAAGVWAQERGFLSPNVNLNPAVYRDNESRDAARALVQSQTLRFDLSDLQPPEFGSTPGQGMWQLFQDFLRNPRDVDGIADKLEKQAKAAWGR